MANSFTSGLETAVETFYERLGAELSNFRLVGDVRTDDVSILQVTDLSGFVNFSAQVAAPAQTDITIGGTSVSSAAYEDLVSVTHKDLRDIPGLATDIAAGLADAAISTLQDLFWTQFTTLHTTAHPDATNYTATGGGTVYFADDFATPVSQANLFTTALSASSLATAREMMRKYLNKASLAMGRVLSAGNLVLVVPPELETTALNLTSSSGEIFDGSALQSRSFSGMQVVVMPGAPSDANNWYLVYRPASPVSLWNRVSPYLQVTRAEATGHWKFYTQLEANVVLSPHEAGIIQASVA